MVKKGWIKALAAIIIGLIVLTGVAGAALLCISGVFVKSTYLEPWEKDYVRRFDDPRIKLAAHGLLAANGHNMQPWKIRLDQNNSRVFYLYADSSRISGQVDPLARQMMITQGTFLGYLEIAGARLGYHTAIQMFPQGGYDEGNLLESMNTTPLAQITLNEAAPQEAPLYDYLFLPDTNRAPYQPGKLTPEQIRVLENLTATMKPVAADNSLEGGTLSLKILQDQENIAKLGSYAVQGAAVEAGVERVMKETEAIFQPNEYQKNQYRYGFSVEGQGTSGIKKHLMQGLVTLFPSLNSGKGSADLFVQSTRSAVDHTPAYAMIITKDNTRVSQVKSGMLYSKLILAAQQQGFVMQPLSQVLEEYQEMSELYQGIHRDYAPEGGTIQMLVRIGRPTKEVPLSMRRDVMELITGE